MLGLRLKLIDDGSISFVASGLEARPCIKLYKQFFLRLSDRVTVWQLFVLVEVARVRDNIRHVACVLNIIQVEQVFCAVIHEALVTVVEVALGAPVVRTHIPLELSSLMNSFLLEKAVIFACRHVAPLVHLVHGIYLSLVLRQ